MLYFSLFIAGYFVGVITFLAIFPPQVKEIEEQEADTFTPILSMDQQREKTVEPQLSSN